MAIQAFAQVQQPAPNPPLPPSIGVWDGAVFLGIAGMLGAAVKQAWDYYRTKDSSGDTLTQMLINDLRLNNTQLIEGNKKGFEELVKATHESKTAFLSVGSKISSDVQSALTSQTAIYASTNQQLSEISIGIKALHARLDKQFDIYEERLNVVEKILSSQQVERDFSSVGTDTQLLA